MLKILRLSSAGGLLLLGGCGTFVPNIQEFPGNAADGQLLVRAIVETVRCEVQDAVKFIIDQDKLLAKQTTNRKRTAEWFDNWGTQVALVLTVEEKTSFNPAALYNPTGLANPPVTFSLAAGASATATRVMTLNFYYTVKELYKAVSCSGQPSGVFAGGSLLIQSDLKLRETLAAHILASGTGALRVPISRSAPNGENAIGHRVTFEVSTSGSVSPSWVLTHATTNPNNTLFSTSRSRTHDLALVLGPANPTERELVGPAQGVFLGNQINASPGRNNR
jgi:hypothetical protein